MKTDRPEKMSTIVDTAQNKIKEILKRLNITIKDIATQTNTPYTTVYETLNKPGRLNIPWLAWYASFFGVTTDFLLSRDKPDKGVGEKLRLARENADLKFPIFLGNGDR